MNTAVELHDSEIRSVRRDGDDTILELIVCVHSSGGVAGLDPGETWEQEAELRIRHAQVEYFPPDGRLSILSGSVKAASDTFDDVLPMPFDRAGSVVVQLSGPEGRFSATGRALLLVLKGFPRNVEPFPS